MGLVQARLYPVDRGRRGVLASSLRLSGPRPVGGGLHAGGGGVASAPQAVGLRLCPHDREELRAHAVHLSGAGHFWAEATFGAQATFGRKPPARIYSRSMVYAYALMIAKKCELKPFTFWAQATVGSGHFWAHATFGLTPPARNP